MIKLTRDQANLLEYLAKGGWQVGKANQYTIYTGRLINLGTARAFIRHGLATSSKTGDVFFGDDIEITQAGRDWLKENRG